MANFLDGPAAGVNLLLGRAPYMIRAVQKPDGSWDALDQLDDTPAADETIVVYRIASERSHFHLCRSPRRLSGWYWQADYRVLTDQPDDSSIRETAAWALWCQQNFDWLVASNPFKSSEKIDPNQESRK